MRTLPSRVRVRVKIQLAPPPIGYVRVELGRRQVGVAEQLLNAAQVGAPLEQVCGERMAEQVRMYACRLEPGLLGQPAQDQERPARVSGPPRALRKSSGRFRRSR